MNVLKNLLRPTGQPMATTSRYLHMYAIKDISANEYGAPFFHPHHTHALRAFRMEVNRKHEHNPYYLFPREYELHYLGTFNQETAELEYVNELIATGEQLKDKE